MSDSANDLLTHGVAAARSKDKEEARFYLEWTLRSEPDLEQETEAWYWLSYITDDPKEKRDCLENVLAISPKYPEARRDLAILEGRLKQEDILGQGRRRGPNNANSYLTGGRRKAILMSQVRRQNDSPARQAGVVLPVLRVQRRRAAGERRGRRGCWGARLGGGYLH